MYMSLTHCCNVVITEYKARMAHTHTHTHVRVYSAHKVVSVSYLAKVITNQVFRSQAPTRNR